LYPKEYLQFLVHFHGDRDYFECHEILEDYWKRTDTGNKESIWVGLILLAVSAYHHRRGNFIGAKRTLEKARNIFSAQEGALTGLGLDGPLLQSLLKGRLEVLQSGESYQSFNLPISDPVLLELCIKNCEKEGFSWGNVSDMTNASLVHRHKLRDRTSVIEERNQALSRKKGSE
jgi:predicted metal-dependent hydrolase